jgi:membrane protease YdiL (CAAX protease family)
MLFLLKRTVPTALGALLILTALGLALRHSHGDRATPLHFTPWLVLLGVGVCGIVLVSDALIHGTLLLAFGEAYRRRHVELAAVFRDQTLPALVSGALMAGVGEELVFRGWGTELTYLLPMALLFGVLHHIRGSLWHATVWAVWEGVLFALALYLTEQLAVTMTAHFLHDLCGFLLFRQVNGRAREARG